MDRYFDELWRWAEDELESILAQERTIAATLPEKNRNLLYGRVCKIYLRYIVVARRLEECYQQMVYVQKRKDVATLLKAVRGRIVELKVVAIIVCFFFVRCMMMSDKARIITYKKVTDLVDEHHHSRANDISLTFWMAWMAFYETNISHTNKYYHSYLGNGAISIK